LRRRDDDQAHLARDIGGVVFDGAAEVDPDVGLVAEPAPPSAEFEPDFWDEVGLRRQEQPHPLGMCSVGEVAGRDRAAAGRFPHDKGRSAGGHDLFDTTAVEPVVVELSAPHERDRTIGDVDIVGAHDAEPGRIDIVPPGGSNRVTDSGIQEPDPIPPFSLDGEAHRRLESGEPSSGRRERISDITELSCLRVEEVFGVPPDGRGPEVHVAIEPRDLVHSEVLRHGADLVPGVGLDPELEVESEGVERGGILVDAPAGAQVARGDDGPAGCCAPAGAHGASGHAGPVAHIRCRPVGGDPHALAAGELMSLGDDVDDAALGIGAVEHGRRPSNDLDTLDHLGIDGGEVLPRAIPVSAVVERNAVDEVEHLVPDHATEYDGPLASRGLLHVDAGHVPQEIDGDR
jgi:hypothetical protein